MLPIVEHPMIAVENCIFLQRTDIMLDKGFTMKNFHGCTLEGYLVVSSEIWLSTVVVQKSYILGFHYPTLSTQVALIYFTSLRNAEWQRSHPTKGQLLGWRWLSAWLSIQQRTISYLFRATKMARPLYTPEPRIRLARGSGKRSSSASPTANQYCPLMFLQQQIHTTRPQPTP